MKIMENLLDDFEEPKNQDKSFDETIDDLKSVMSSESGRRFIWKILSDCNCFHTSFSNDSLMMAFREGRKGFGLEMLNRVTNFCPELYLKMQSEQINGKSGKRAIRRESNS